MISTKGRYALNIMLDIRDHENGEPVRLKDIAKRQELSEKYLEQIALVLRKNGFLGGVRGANGGYYLKKPAKDISVGEILRAMEGDLAPAPCVEENGVPCKRKGKCTNNILWKKINDAVNSVIDNVSLEDMHMWEIQES